MEAAIHCSRHALRLLGQEARPPATVSDLIALCHRDDQQTLRGLLQRLVISDLGRRGACCCRLRAESPSRSIRWEVELLGGVDGSFLVGTVRDGKGAAAGLGEVPCQSQQPDAVAIAANVGSWDWTISTNQLAWDSVMVRLYGSCPEQWAGTYQAWLGAIHGQDRDRVDAEIQAALRGESQFASRFHVVWPDGSLHQRLALSHTSFDPQGRPMRMLGVTIDLTDQLA